MVEGIHFDTAADIQTFHKESPAPSSKGQDLRGKLLQSEDGLHQMKLLDAVLASNEKRSWVELSTE